MTLAPIQAKMLRRLLEVGSLENIRRSLEKLHPSDIALLFSELPPDDIARLLEILFTMKKAGLVLSEMPEYFLPEILPKIEDKKLATSLSNLEPDDALVLLDQLPDERQDEVMGLLPPKVRSNLERLILYPKDSAGSIMNVDIVSLREDLTAQDSIEHLRANKEHIGINYLYVVDEGNRLSGILNMRDLLLAKADTNIAELMTRDVISVDPMTDREEVAQQFAQYDLLSMPVVDSDRTLLGTITVDDIIDIVKEEATEDMYYMAGLSEADRAFSPIRESVRRRLPWMTFNLATAMVAALVVGLFQQSIVKAVSLAIFMPVVAQLSGNVGTQTLTVITRSIAIGEFEFATAWKAVIKEMFSGLTIGLVLGTILALLSYLWTGNLHLGGLLLLALILTMVIAGTAGSLIPLTLRALKIDPALGSSVLVQAITDATSFAIFLGLGTLFLNRLGAI